MSLVTKCRLSSIHLNSIFSCRFGPAWSNPFLSQQSNKNKFQGIHFNGLSIPRSFSTKPTHNNISNNSTPSAPNSDPNDINNFEFLPQIKNNLIREFKLKTFFPIQAESLEPIRSGKDFIGRSRTGTGKTLAFLLPLVERLLRSNTSPNPNEASLVILEPTRELANQVLNEVNKLIANTHLKAVVVYGGVPYYTQENALRRGVDILIATPGRLIDHIEKQNVRLNNVMACVLDEADEMLRMGFVDSVEEIMGSMPKTKQLLLFSATMPAWVSSIIRKHTKNPVLIDKVTGTDAQTSLTVSHKAICSPSDIKTRAGMILGLIKSYATNEDGTLSRVIIFTRTKLDADQLASAVSEAGAKARALHGDVPQSRREFIMDDFRNNRFKVLVATDVAARGIDIPNVAMVVQSWFPDEVESYVHRSGRTGRAGKSGVSVILFDPSERQLLANLSNEVQASIEVVYPPQASHSTLNIKKEIEDFSKRSNTKMFKPLAEEILKSPPQALNLLSAMIFRLYGETHSSRSILTSSKGFVTVQVNGRGRQFDPATRLAEVLQLDELDPATIEYFSQGALCDIPSDLADKLSEIISEQNIQDISIPAQLPDELFSEKSHGHSFRSSQGSRSRSNNSMSSGNNNRFGQNRNSYGSGDSSRSRQSDRFSDRSSESRYRSGNNSRSDGKRFDSYSRDDRSRNRTF